MNKGFTTITSVLIILAVIAGGYLIVYKPVKETNKVVELGNSAGKIFEKDLDIQTRTKGEDILKGFTLTSWSTLSFYRRDIEPHYYFPLGISSYYYNSDVRSKAVFLLEEVAGDKKLFDTLEVNPNSYCVSCKSGEVIVTTNALYKNNQNYKHQEAAIVVCSPESLLTIYQAWHVNPDEKKFEKIVDLKNVEVSCDHNFSD